MLVQALRSLVFYVLFYVQTTVLAIVLGTLAIIVRKPFALGLWIVNYWCNSNLLMLRVIAGIRSEVTGLENLPEGGCIIASKHQSDWDVFAILPPSQRPAFIAKKELMNIPFLGWAARTFETITIDRSLGGRAIPQMVEDARSAADRGCRIIIFPEGTRRPPLAESAYKVGASRIYAALDVPVVPVALNSGLFWGRRQPVLWPGRARAHFLPPIPPGLPAVEMQRRLIEAIETETDRLVVEAWREGITRPLGEDMQRRLKELTDQAEA